MKTAENIVKEKVRKLISVSPGTTIQETLNLMVDNKIGAIAISENDKIIGIWTERDLLRNILTPNFNPKTARIGDHLILGIISAPHSASVKELLDKFVNMNIRHLVIEKNGEIIGLISVGDVIRHSFREKTRDYKNLFEHVGCGVYISSKEGKFLDANPALLKMLGYDSKEEFLNIDIKDDLYLRPEDRKPFQEIIERDGQVIDYEVDFKRRDGRPISLLLTSHVRYDENGNISGYEGINVDQSQRKQMEKELREANDFLNKIIHSSSNAIMAADMKGNIILWNSAAEEILGYSSKDVINKLNIAKIYPEGMAQKIMKMIRSPEHGGVGKLNSYPLLIVRKDEEIVEGNLSAALIYDENGNELATVGIVVDLKERLSMERRLRQTQEQLLQSEKLAAMGRLTSQLAHELNNPLYGIMNTFELLKTEISPQNKRRKILDMALSETIRLSEMLRKMLSFSKPDQEIKQTTDINTVLDEILLLHEKQLRENNILISSKFARNLAPVNASKNQLRQIFLNMISNARDAMPEGGTLNIQTFSDKDNIIIEISDTGMGIKEENMDQIFDTFFTTKNGVKGIGLGLSVCYGFIKDHGGDVVVKSIPGSGTTFTITLPIYKTTNTDPT